MSLRERLASDDAGKTFAECEKDGHKWCLIFSVRRGEGRRHVECCHACGAVALGEFCRQVFE